MTRVGIIVIAALSLAAGMGSFLATQAVGTAGEGWQPGGGFEHGVHEPLIRWLELSDEQAGAMRKADPTFGDEAEALSAELDRQREKLAGLLELVTASDQQIMAQVERVIAAHDTLERRAARHVLKIRHHLTPDQRRRLMGLAAGGVREARRYRWRGARGAGSANGGGRRYRGGR